MSRFYLTTPIYYVNDAPHIGHAYTTVAADVLARFKRMCGHDVAFLTGTDEHGLKVQRAAEARGVTPQQHADEFSVRFVEMNELLDITNTDFIRTTEPRHAAAVQELLQRCYDAGDIELDTYEGQYCVPCEAYYAEDELVGGNCPIHDRPVERVVEENYFFRLSRYQQRLLDYYEAHAEAAQPDSRRNEVLGFIRQGLRDFSVSRTSITWGIPLPWDPKHVTYVWFDALTNYCSAAGLGADPTRFAAEWPADVHLIGKDILRFHAVYWPAMLMSAGIELPRQVFAHGWLLVGGEKMSKTKLNAIAPAELVETFGVDGYRYHFMADQRFGPDGDFSFEAMVTRYNADLANNFGNLASRVLNMAKSYCDGITVEPAANAQLKAAAESNAQAYVASMNALDFASALAAVQELIRAANAHIEDRQPWALAKADQKVAAAAVVADCLEVVRMTAIMMAPVTPRASAELWERLGYTSVVDAERIPSALAWGLLPAGQPIEKGSPLFPRIEGDAGA
ncbi:MAG: methionine--tRNA ligase [Acidimicrobiia bacterium]